MSERGAQDEPLFDEPWQAEALAMAVALQDTGLIAPTEWSEALGRQRRGDNLRSDGGDYYHCVVTALEELLEARGIASRAGIDSLSDAWARAARATPHGTPIALENDPLRGGALGRSPA